MMTYRTLCKGFTLGFTLLLTTGCSSSSYFTGDADLLGPTAVTTASEGELVRLRPIFTGDGTPIGWQDLLDASEWAEIIIIGEMHDDAVGHRIQRAIVSDVTAMECSTTALAMEMLERDEQLLIDDYYDGIIDAEQFAELTFSTKWAGEGSWAAWYQPIIDAARRNGAPTIAANAPRRYVRLARTDGYTELRELPEAQRALFELPVSVHTGAYQERFFGLMSDMGDHSNPNDDGAMHVPPAMIKSMYRAQLVWDATMAESVVRALRDDVDRVILLLGQFHSDFNGGTVQEIRRRSPTSDVLTISLQQRDGRDFHPEDVDRADVIIYTGARPEEIANGEHQEESEDAKMDPVTSSPHDAPAAQPLPPAPTPPAPQTPPGTQPATQPDSV